MWFSLHSHERMINLKLCVYIFDFFFLWVQIIYLRFSGKDNMVPSRDEAQRLMSSLQNCTVRHFNDNGHTLLLVSLNMYVCYESGVIL